MVGRTLLQQAVPTTFGLVAATWAQSYVRDEAIRQILFDIGMVRNRLAQAAPDAPDVDVLSKSYANLLRKVAEA